MDESDSFHLRGDDTLTTTATTTTTVLTMTEPAVLPRIKNPSPSADVEEEKSDSDHDDNDEESPFFMVGGTILKEALCLLDGIQEETDANGNNNSSKDTEKPQNPVRNSSLRVTFPIQRLPAILGRAHEPDNNKRTPYFVELGKTKAVSRQHVRIDYRIALSNGMCGHVQSNKGGSEFTYCADDNPVSVHDLVFPDSATTISKHDSDLPSTLISSVSQLPATGFYTLTCLGKNRVLISGRRLEPGQTTVLPSGTPIRVANFCLYFLTPLENSNNHVEVKTMQIREEPPLTSTKKRKLSMSSSTSVGTKDHLPVPVLSSSKGATSPVVTKPTKGSAIQSETEDMSTADLLQQIAMAVEENMWDRRLQFVGSTVSYRAVLVAAQDPTLRQLAADSDGQLSRSEIMDWIAATPPFATWVDHMLTKLESKSYQASITKALIKAGFKRTATSGRYIKWLLPDALPPKTDTIPSASIKSHQPVIPVSSDIKNEQHEDYDQLSNPKNDDDMNEEDYIDEKG